MLVIPNGVAPSAVLDAKEDFFMAAGDQRGELVACLAAAVGEFSNRHPD